MKYWYDWKEMRRDVNTLCREIVLDKFDPEVDYIRSYVPELCSCASKLIHDPGSASPAEIEKHGITIGKDYPLPIVDLKESREAALTAYKNMKETILAA